MSQGQCFGLLAFWDNNLVNQEYQDRKKTLQFLADLGALPSIASTAINYGAPAGKRGTEPHIQ